MGSHRCHNCITQTTWWDFVIITAVMLWPQLYLYRYYLRKTALLCIWCQFLWWSYQYLCHFHRIGSLTELMFSAWWLRSVAYCFHTSAILSHWRGTMANTKHGIIRFMCIWMIIGWIKNSVYVHTILLHFQFCLHLGSYLIYWKSHFCIIFSSRLWLRMCFTVLIFSWWLLLGNVLLLQLAKTDITLR